MADGQDVIRLTVDMGASATNIAVVNKELDAMVARAVAATASQRALGRALDEGLEQSAGKARKTGQAMLEVSRAFQDFAQGGIGGVLNNLEGLTRSMETLKTAGLVKLISSPEGIAGAVTILGTAAYVAWPHIQKMWEELTAPAKEKIPATTDRLGKLTEAMKANMATIADLRKEGSLYGYQLDQLREAEDKLKVQQEALRLAQEARAVGPLEARAVRERAGAFREALQEYGGGQRLIDALLRAGYTLERAEGAVALALRGERGVAESIQAALRGRGADQILYLSPEARERAARQREQTEAILQHNADRARAQKQMREAEWEQQNREGERQREANERAQERERKAQEQHMADARIWAAQNEAAGVGAGAVRVAGGARRVQEMQRRAFQATGVDPGLIATAEFMVQQKRTLNADFNEALMNLIMAIQEGNFQMRQGLGMLGQGARDARGRNQPGRMAGWN